MKNTILLYAALAVCIAINSGCKKDNSGTNPIDSKKPLVTLVGTPTGPAVTASIDASGGTLSSADGMLQLIVPAGAVSSATTFSIQPITNHCPGGKSNAYRLLPEDITFAQPVTVNLFYADTITSNEEYLTIAFQDTSKTWFSRSSSTIDTSINKISVNTKHFCSAAPSSILFIYPDYSIVKVNKSVALAINVVGETPRFYDEYGEICVGFASGTDLVFEWEVIGGDRYGRIEKKGDHAGTYFAPPSVPPNNPIAIVMARLTNLKIFLNGKIYEAPRLQATIRIIDDALRFKVVFSSRMENPLPFTTDDNNWFAETDFSGLTVVMRGKLLSDVTVEDIWDQKPTISPTVLFDKDDCIYTIINTGDGYYNNSPDVLWECVFYDLSQVKMVVRKKLSTGFTPTYKKQCTSDTTVYEILGGKEVSCYPILIEFNVGEDYQESHIEIKDGSGITGRFYQTSITKVK